MNASPSLDNPDKISYLGDTIGNDELENSGLTLIGDDGNYLDNLHLGETLKIKGGEGMDVLLENNRITISGEDASTTNKGISKYDNVQFNVTDGNVEIQDIYVKNSGDTINGDLNINGNQNISGKINVNGIENSGYYTQTGTDANTFTGTSTFSNPTYSALFIGGNVGIGTTAPGAKLEIAGTTDSTQMIIRANTTQSNTNPLFQLVSAGGDGLMDIHSDDESNIFIGVGAGSSNDISDGLDGFYNTFVGFNAGIASTTGNSNSVLGAESLFSNTIGSYNIALGTRSLYSNTEGTSNIAIGDASLYSNTEGYSNVAIGDESLYSNIDGTSNIAIGEDSLYSNIDGGSNIAIGKDSLNGNTSGYYNVAIGESALQWGEVGNENTAIGYLSLMSTEGEENVGIGNYSLLYNVDGSQNTAVGVGSLSRNEFGNENVALGTRAGLSNEDGSGNIFLGYRAGYYETGSNKLFIDNQQRGSEADARTKALMYGIFDAAVANQSLTINGALNVTGTTTITGNLLPSANDTYNLGSDTMRFANAWLGGETLHIGTADADEGEIGYTTATNVMTVQSNGNLALQAGSGNVGIGTTAPGYKFVVQSSTQATAGDFNVDTTNGSATVTVGRLSGTANDNTSFNVRNRLGGSTFFVSTSGIGNVGIGTTALLNSFSVYNATSWADVTNPQVNIFGADNEAETMAFRIQDENSNEYFRVSSTGAGNYEKGKVFIAGKVGIGTTNPGGSLSIGTADRQLNVDSNGWIYFQAGAWGNPAAGMSWDNSAGRHWTQSVYSASNDIGMKIASGNGKTFYMGWSETSNNYISGGNLGIGITAPSYPLQVSSGYVKTDTNIRLVGMFGSNEGNTSFGLKMSVVGAATPATSMFALQTGDNTLNTGSLALQAYGGNVGIGTTNPTNTLYVNAPGGGVTIDNGSNSVIPLTVKNTQGWGLYLQNSLAQNYNIGSYPDGSLKITNPGNLGDILAIKSGNVGIGTTSPNIISANQTHLDIRSSSYPFLEIGATTVKTSDDVGYLEFMNGNNVRAATIVGGADGTSNLGYLRFSTATAGSFSERMRINSAGNVGIGTTNPGYSLDVNGSTNIANTGAYRIGTSQVLSKGAGQLTGNLFVGNGGGSVSHGSGPEGYDNTALGFGTLTVNSTGYWNTGIGSGVLSSNTIGFRNTAVGTYALAGVTTGNYNSAFGAEAMSSNTSGQSNVAIGRMTGYYNQTGSYNTLVGGDSGAGVTGNSYSNNTFIGYQTGYSTTTGGNNFFGGYQAGYSNTTASTGVFIGYQAGYSNTTAEYNTFSGYQTGYANITGNHNTGGGYKVLYANSTGSGNVGYGSRALIANTIGNYNTASGWDSLGANTTGSNNSAYGLNTLGYNQTGSSNVAIGANALLGINGNSFSNNTAIGDGAGRHVTTGSSNFFGGGQAGYENAAGSKNVVIGYQAATNATGSNTVVIGYQAGYSNTSSNLTATGYQAGYSNTTGYSNFFGGHQAGYSNNSGYQNSAIGASALYSNTTGIFNSALGFQSLYTNNTGNYNTAVGSRTMHNNTTGYWNSAMGMDALYSNIDGVGNTALGNGTLYSNTSGGSNVAIGMDSLHSNTTGSQNIAIGGLRALYSNTTGSDNVIVGTYALYDNTTGRYNVAMGLNAISGNITGSSNVALGERAGQFQANGSTLLTDPESSIYIGSYAMGYNNSDSNSIVIGARAVGIGANTAVLGNDSITTTALKGKIGIGTTAPTYKLQVVDSTATSSGGYNKVLTAHSTGLATGATSQFAWGKADTAYNQAEFNFYYAGDGSTSNQLRMGVNGNPGIITMQGNGNVGIGTTDPGTARLSVQGGGIVVGAPTGGDKGAGTINATAVYDDNVILTDYVFDKYFDGTVRVEDEPLHSDYSMLSLDQMSDYITTNRHLPTIPGRDEWQQNGKFSLGVLANHLWETAETQALYVVELDNNIEEINSNWVIENGETEIEELKNRVAELEKINVGASLVGALEDNDNDNVEEGDDTPPALQADPSQEGIENENVNENETVEGETHPVSPTAIHPSQEGINEQITDKLSILGIGEIDETITAFFKEIWFTAKVTFEKTATFLADVTFGGKVKFSKNIEMGKDSVGQATIIAETDNILINFEEGYTEEPIITATPTEFVDGSFKIITEKDPVTELYEKFKIELEKNQSKDVKLNWHAFGKINE